jgi:hypothetical protein
VTKDENVKAAIAAARQVTAFFRSAERAMLGSHFDWSAHLAHEGFKEAQRAATLILRLGDPARGLAELQNDTSIHTMQPAGQMAQAMAAAVDPSEK